MRYPPLFCYCLPGRYKYDTMSDFLILRRYKSFLFCQLQEQLAFPRRNSIPATHVFLFPECTIFTRKFYLYSALMELPKLFRILPEQFQDGHELFTYCVFSCLQMGDALRFRRCVMQAEQENRLQNLVQRIQGSVTCIVNGQFKHQNECKLCPFTIRLKSRGPCLYLHVIQHHIDNG